MDAKYCMTDEVVKFSEWDKENGHAGIQLVDEI
jgi:hypothetical protein